MWHRKNLLHVAVLPWYDLLKNAVRHASSVYRISCHEGSFNVKKEPEACNYFTLVSVSVYTVLLYCSSVDHTHHLLQKLHRPALFVLARAHHRISVDTCSRKWVGLVPHE